MSRISARLKRHRRCEARPPVVWITYETACMSQQALERAKAAGLVPDGAWIVLLPAMSESLETWERECKADRDQIERERQAERAERAE